MSRVASRLYGVTAYLIFLIAFLYAIGFTGGILVPKAIDDGDASQAWATAVAVNLGLLTLFALQHSIMARPGFKRWWTRMVPQPIERSTYVLLASLALLLLFWQWRPLTAPVWTVSDPILSSSIQAVFWLGWLTVLASSFMISHFDLFGLKQAFSDWQANRNVEADFKTPMLYRYVRHPIYLGFLMAFWSAPVMSVGHLLFAAVTTGYILIGARLEERDLLRFFGERYRLYCEQVGMLVPRLRLPFAGAKREGMRLNGQEPTGGGVSS